MTKRVFRNTDVHTRVWTSLTDPETGTTLALEPGEEKELDLPEDFEDVNLVRKEKVRRAKKEDETPPEDPATPAEDAPPEDVPETPETENVL